MSHTPYTMSPTHRRNGDTSRMFVRPAGLTEELPQQGVRPPMRRRSAWTLGRRMAAGLTLVLMAVGAIAGELTEAETRLLSTVEYLASDELQGRGIGTEGLDRAADYIAERFAEIGLKTKLFDGTPFQEFTISTSARLGEHNEAALVGPNGQRIELKLGEDFTPLAIGGSGDFDLPLVFVGYGITAPDEGYDDYQGIDVKGKAVVVLRHEPQQDNPHSVFNGTEHSQYAPFSRKVANASEHEAAAIVFVTDEFELQRKLDRRVRRYRKVLDELRDELARFSKFENPTVDEVQEHLSRMDALGKELAKQQEKMRDLFDPVLRFNAAGQEGDDRRFPVLHMRRGVIDRVLQQVADTSLAELERRIDKGPAPQSRELAGWRLVGHVEIERKKATVKNVVGVLEGQGPLAEETIIIGAHYDHLGMGGPGSLAPGVKAVHNGADDNASGVAALIEVARQLASRPEKLRRRVVFIAFTAEERGLVGSAYYVRHPLVPLETTVAMLNMDMVGRLKDNKLIVYGTGAAAEFDSLIDEFNEKYGFEITKRPTGFGPSDHATFYGKKIPALHFFTGTHPDYHRPTDDVDKINVAGMQRIAQMVTDLAVHLANDDERPTYQATRRSQRTRGGDRPYFGSIPDFAQDAPGYALSGVAKESPAEKAGIRGGDVIVRFGESKITNLEDFDSALRKYKAGDKVKVVVLRDGKQQTFEVTLDPPR